MDNDYQIQEIAGSLTLILSQLDELDQHVAAIKVAEAIRLLSEINPEHDIEIGHKSVGSR
ncbi:MAG: hypothetical protein ABJ360_24335 [Roseobacter sp.]|uniref:hypothetical protein n=1 Tax=Parasphingorhabdus sp. TaxID=2709688 RepID=UPI0032639499